MIRRGGNLADIPDNLSFFLHFNLIVLYKTKSQLFTFPYKAYLMFVLKNFPITSGEQSCSQVSKLVTSRSSVSANRLS
jgi:hypothetical protein